MGKIYITYCLACFLTFCLFSCNNESNQYSLGVVTTATPEASKVGEQILLKGGNAIDAAIAISFALGVTEPAMSGLGGGTQVLLSINNQPPISINGTTYSPANTPAHIKDTLTYHRRSTIPSTVKVLDYLWKTYGSGKISWEQLIEPSIALAKNGFKVGEFRAKVYQYYETKLVESPFNTSYFLKNNSQIPEEGDIINQPQLAVTLKRLAKYGADDFYNGEIAKKIADDMNNNGGWITLEDLNNFPEPKELQPLSINYNNMIVYSQPPPCGGWTTLLALNLMEEASKDNVLTDLEIINSLYLAHTDRQENPITDLINYDSVAQVKLSKSYTKNLNYEFSQLPSNTNDNNSGETTHFSVVDASGNAIAVTSSINAYFGSLAASKELGFLYNTYMDDFIFENLNHPFAIKPHAMAYSSMSPTIVQENGENILVIGSPGSSRIISSVSQITALWLLNKNIEPLIKRPRIHVSKNNIYFENKTDSLKIYSFIKANGYTIKIPSEKLMIQQNMNAYYGGIHAIAKENNTWIGVADPRRDGLKIDVKKQ